jgi:hypothetical protein
MTNPKVIGIAVTFPYPFASMRETISLPEEKCPMELPRNS